MLCLCPQFDQSLGDLYHRWRACVLNVFSFHFPRYIHLAEISVLLSLHLVDGDSSYILQMGKDAADQEVSAADVGRTVYHDEL